MRRSFVLIASACLCIWSPSAIAQTPQLILLNPVDQPSASTFAYGLSPDGGFVAGNSNNSSAITPGYRWSMDGTATLLGLLNGPGWALARSVCNGGGVVVGDALTSSTGVHEAFRWTPGGGMQGIGFLPGATDSYAQDVSGDGNAIVGASGNQAYLHTMQSGMTPLGFLPGDQSSFATSCSANGSVVTGYCENSNGAPSAFRWSAQTGMTALGLPSVDSRALGVSADGSTIVGEVGIDEAVYWKHGLQVSLPIPDGEAIAASNNGTIIVGNGHFGGTSLDQPFIWDAQAGARYLADYLQDEVGLNLGNFVLKSVQDISADGKVISGFGDLPGGPGRGFIAIVPCPSAFLIVMIPMTLKHRRRRVSSFNDKAVTSR